MTEITAGAVLSAVLAASPHRSTIMISIHRTIDFQDAGQALSAHRNIQYLFLLLLLHLLGKLPYELGVASFIGLLLIGIKLFPIFVLGRILISLSPLTIMSSLRKIGIPNDFNLSIATGLRFMSEMEIRMKEIRNGMKVRGLKISLLHPVRSFELYLIPLMYKCLHVSETLTSSIISKGAEYKIKKTSYNPTKYNIFDLICLVVAFYLVWRLF